MQTAFSKGLGMIATRLWRTTVISLFAGFISLMFFIMFPSFLSMDLQLVSPETAQLAVELAAVIIVGFLGAYYFRLETNLRRFSKKKNVFRKVVRNLLLTLISGLTITFLNSTLYFSIVSGDWVGISLVEAGHLSGLTLILQNVFVSLFAETAFTLYFAVSFVVIFLFDMLWSRDHFHSTRPVLTDPLTVS
jgi:hypothetical protein